MVLAIETVCQAQGLPGSGKFLQNRAFFGEWGVTMKRHAKAGI
jgi:hypothetical protein